jgi:hypothetical protein
MHYKDFLFGNLNEYSQKRSQAIKIEEVVKLIKTDYSEAWDKFNDGITIYRGTVNSSDFFITDPSLGIRKSANTLNYYTAIIDNSKRWKDYPKRSKSAICTTSRAYADYYGSAFCVLPINGSNIGVASKGDFWDSFPILDKRLDRTKLPVQGLSGLNTLIKFLISIANPNINTDIKEFSTLAKTLKEVDEYLNKKEYLKDETIKQQMLNDALDFINVQSSGKIDCLKVIDSILDPEDNNFKKIKLSELSIHGDHEVWTDGKCLMINVDELDSLGELL